MAESEEKIEDALVSAAEQEQLELDSKLNNFLERTQKTWALSKKGTTAVSASMSMLATKHGFYSAIPIMCKNEGCPYKATCEIYKNGLAPAGEPCPVEIAKIFTLYDQYSGELQIGEHDEVDKTLLRDLINYEIMLSRCDAKVAEEGDFVQLVAFAATESGDVLERPELSKAVEFREKISKKKYDILQLLNSTRKDKADQHLNVSFSPTQIVDDLIAKANEFDKTFDVDFEVVENEEDTEIIENKEE